MEDKELKKKLSKIPDADKNGDPIYKIAGVESPDKKSADQSNATKKRRPK